MKANHVILLQEGTEQAQITGTVYRKQIAKFGTWINPLYPFFSEDPEMVLDEDWADEMVKNFNKSPRPNGRVAVPSDHTDMTSANTGEVLKLEAVEGDGLYAYMDIRRDETAQDIEKGLIFDVSMAFDWDYVDTKGKHHGIVLIHVALVNSPYLSEMESFEPNKAGALDFAKEFGLAKPSNSSVIMLSASKAKELKEQMTLATIKNTRDFKLSISVKDEDGEAVAKLLKPGEETQVPKDQAKAVLAQIEKAEKPKAKKTKLSKKTKPAKSTKLKKGDKPNAELVKAQAEVAKLRAEKRYNILLKAGKITPAQKDQFMALAEAGTGKVELSEGKKVSLSKAVFEIMKAGPKVVSFKEKGSGKTPESGKTPKNSDKKPSEQLTETEQRGMQATGADPERMDKLAKKYPAMRDQLTSKESESK